MKVNLFKPTNYGKQVFWVEKDHLGRDQVESGILLGGYEYLIEDEEAGCIPVSTKYIVTLGGLDSCVVRHLETFYEGRIDAVLEMIEGLEHVPNGVH